MIFLWFHNCFVCLNVFTGSWLGTTDNLRVDMVLCWIFFLGWDIFDFFLYDSDNPPDLIAAFLLHHQIICLFNRSFEVLKVGQLVLQLYFCEVLLDHFELLQEEAVLGSSCHTYEQKQFSQDSLVTILSIR